MISKYLNQKLNNCFCAKLECIIFVMETSIQSASIYSISMDRNILEKQNENYVFTFQCFLTLFSSYDSSPISTIFYIPNRSARCKNTRSDWFHLSKLRPCMIFFEQWSKYLDLLVDLSDAADKCNWNVCWVIAIFFFICHYYCI